MIHSFYSNITSTQSQPLIINIICKHNLHYLHYTELHNSKPTIVITYIFSGAFYHRASIIECRKRTVNAFVVAGPQLLKQLPTATWATTANTSDCFKRALKMLLIQWVDFSMQITTPLRNCAWGEHIKVYNINININIKIGSSLLIVYITFLLLYITTRVQGLEEYDEELYHSTLTLTFVTRDFHPSIHPCTLDSSGNI